MREFVIRNNKDAEVSLLKDLLSFGTIERWEKQYWIMTKKYQQERANIKWFISTMNQRAMSFIQSQIRYELHYQLSCEHLQK